MCLQMWERQPWQYADVQGSCSARKVLLVKAAVVWACSIRQSATAPNVCLHLQQDCC